MGYDPSEQSNSRLFAMGFIDFSADINIGFYNSAVGMRLNSSECPRDLGDIPGESVFLAGKSIGSSSLNTIGAVRAAVTIVSNSVDDDLGPFSEDVHSGLGTQSNEDSQTFTATAVGYIDSSKTIPTESSLWTINHLKKLSNFRPGY